MNNSAHFHQKKPVFYGELSPEEGTIVGYAAIIDKLKLQIPMVKPITLVCNQNKHYENEEWVILPKSYLPKDNQDQDEIKALYRQLVFALKYEGINLLFFSFLTKHFSEVQLTKLVKIEPTGQYSRRIWFLIEWLLGKNLAGKENLSKKSYVPVVDIRQQYSIKGTKSPRHLVINNLPGTRNFCPLVRKTKKLEKYINDNLSNRKNDYLNGIRKDIIQRASGFLLLKDSRASFSIEGESPKSKRAARWGQAIGQAGARELKLEELKRLQQIVIENARFIELGFREKGGFIGEHDRISGEPMPEHISAKWQDLPELLDGLIETNKLLVANEIDAVVSATIIAFGFVFIHPFEDGNGRIHRYLIHHILAKKSFAQQGIIFPVSASILDHIEDYKNVLEAYSHPLLDFIEWEETKDHNVNVLNETIDYYKFYDATVQAEFLYDCVFDTIENIIPNELTYLLNYEAFKKIIDDVFEMPDRLVAMLVKFLSQNNGVLLKSAREKEFSALTAKEVEFIEKRFIEIFELSQIQ
ncbi:Fic family protein [uncultured Cyclobacterium sp.]|uniref:Fic family protein n=1 Tax=uncultured Cyclobacterium sp. TaxID=453820 RepID=UPI0030EEF718|tara:strand:- start:296206 stop:297783 length:1578 start_codon:yes stop_codon:yes gene_type:complete